MTNTGTRWRTIAVLGGLAAAMAGCVSYPGGGGGGVPVRPASGIEGAWIDAQGTGLSSLSGGVFQTVATDTGQKLSEGSYILTGSTSVQITGVSLLRRARGEPDALKINCLLVSANQMNCTSQNNQQFVLQRR